MKHEQIYNRKMAKRDKSEAECWEMEMSPAQREVFIVIDEWWKKFGYGPSIDEIMYVTGDRGRGNVHRKIRSLMRAGHLKGVPNMARSIRPAYLKVYKIENS